ncbi:MAG: permease [Armatimonadota bacterium]
MTALDALVLFATGAVASGLNAVAGGGSLVSFPVLTLGFHMPDVRANATSSVGLFPGSLAGGLGRPYLRALFLPSLLGSIGGALLLLSTSDALFRRAVPWLILMAALLLLAQPHIRRWAGRAESDVLLPPTAGWIVQLFVGVYGGYFGAGMGIMMLACFSLFMAGTVHEINAVKNWLQLVINATCSAVFLLKGVVLWHFSLVIVAGSLVGGYYAARLSQRFDPNRLRSAIAIYGLAMAAYYFWRAYGPGH